MRSLAWALTALASGCFVSGFEVDDGATTGASASASTGAGLCASTPFPAPAGKGSGDGLDLRFALANIDFGEAEIDVDQDVTDCSRERVRIGYDLDGRCSGCGCTTGDLSCIPAGAEACDAVRGIDNGIAQVVAPYAQSLDGAVGSGQLTRDAMAGTYVVLLRVWNYDGSPDDDSVSFAIYGGRPPATVPPVWDGTDTYPVGGEWVTSWNTASAIDRPNVRTDQAYVVGGRLVAVLEGSIPFGPPGLTLPFTSGRVEASLVQEGGRWTLRNATVGGRTEVAPFLTAVGEVSRLGVPLCNLVEVWGRFRQLSCQNRDLPPGAPGPVPCSAISFGFRVEAREVRFGTVVAPVVPTKRCAPLDADPCMGL